MHQNAVARLQSVEERPQAHREEIEPQLEHDDVLIVGGVFVRFRSVLARFAFDRLRRVCVLFICRVLSVFAEVQKQLITERVV